ncbi:hypothetical protein TNIN_487081 [Trichonephila inaurata madagascariensis]|uniref:Uncharacterized protein n=1 Tax=Trichonephila inaurata madagascariensis TaxID=2747483 RepID=A0A8X6Y018_9ARAC|nr:hypothetical protein TNIN_487081 [Trichonephila inaurata madagascariensis]
MIEQSKIPLVQSRTTQFPIIVQVMSDPPVTSLSSIGQLVPSRPVHRCSSCFSSRRSPTSLSNTLRLLVPWRSWRQRPLESRLRGKSYIYNYGFKTYMIHTGQKLQNEIFLSACKVKNTIFIHGYGLEKFI